MNMDRNIQKLISV